MSACLVYTCQTPKEYNLSVNNNSKKHQEDYFKQYSHKKFYRGLDNKIEITEYKKIYLYLKNNLTTRNICGIPWNKIEIQENIKNIIKNKFKLDIDDFYPSQYVFNNTDIKKNIIILILILIIIVQNHLT